MESIKQKRAERKQWVTGRLKTAGHSALDAAAFVGINPRTWREWVALGIIPKQKKPLVLEVLDTDEQKLGRHFACRGA
jgi:hypothetical protein